MKLKQQRNKPFRLLCVCCVLLLLFSFALILIEARHDCKGDDCPICALLRNALSSNKSSVPAALCFFVAAASALSFLWFLQGRPLRCRTPVHEKIRLNN